MDYWVDNCDIRNDDAGAFCCVFDVFSSSASKQYLWQKHKYSQL
tara:strand:- start:2184 stop:2315 length:132 start_codon:yes stop_codon:yes gene_type:complete